MAAPQSSTIPLTAEGPLPVPSPWHLVQFASNSSRPRVTDSRVGAGSAAIAIGFPGPSVRCALLTRVPPARLPPPPPPPPPCPRGGPPPTPTPPTRREDPPPPVNPPSPSKGRGEPRPTGCGSPHSPPPAPRV